MYERFSRVMEDIAVDFKHYSTPVHTERWQGWNIQGNPSYRTHELLNYQFKVDCGGYEHDLEAYASDIKPNLPWADNHFLERVGGHPINPGIEWANWPGAAAANKHRAKDEKFNHNYMERFWPKFARHPGLNSDGSISDLGPSLNSPHFGIAHEYGDLSDVVKLLIKEPLTRQAYLPMFFPEDTGYGDGGRKPCTLGYQFIMRDKRLHVYYPLRSCDFVRHFRDDIYLAIRLGIWVIEQCRKEDPMTWNEVMLGTYSMHMTSFHIFENDWITLFGKAYGK